MRSLEKVSSDTVPRKPSPVGVWQRGFTLIEVVIAIGILSILLSIGYTALRNILRSKELLDDGRDIRLVSDSVLLRITRELQLAYDRDMGRLPSCQEKDPPPLPAADSFRGEPGRNGPDQLRADSVTFLALEGGQYLPDGGGHSGVVQIRYYIAPTPPDDPSGGGPYTLVREGIPYLKPFKRACERAVIFPISNRIRSLELSYYDAKNDTWTDSWIYPERDHLPAVVRFTATFQTTAGKISSFTTSVPLRSSNPL